MSIIPNDRATASEFTNEERARYSRHLIMPEVTREGQRTKSRASLCLARRALDHDRVVSCGGGSRNGLDWR